MRKMLIHLETIYRICLCLLRRMHLERDKREKESKERRCVESMDRATEKTGMEKRKIVPNNFVKKSQHSDELKFLSSCLSTVT